MGRPLYILAATLAGLALLCFVLSVTTVGQQPGSPGDVSLWRTSGIVLFVIALIVALAGTLTTLFDQAERRHEEQRRSRRRPQ